MYSYEWVAQVGEQIQLVNCSPHIRNTGEVSLQHFHPQVLVVVDGVWSRPQNESKVR